MTTLNEKFNRFMEREGFNVLFEKETAVQRKSAEHSDERANLGVQHSREKDTLKDQHRREKERQRDSHTREKEQARAKKEGFNMASQKIYDELPEEEFIRYGKNADKIRIELTTRIAEKQKNEEVTENYPWNPDDDYDD
tara:strand:+ start:2960 stop:3376 length:417 start_codon:yes stop_codon:yes gene_type:complete